MIEVYTNTDALINLSDSTPAPVDGVPSKDIRLAAQDINNLREYAERLEKEVQTLSGQIMEKQSDLENATQYRDAAAGSFLNLIEPALSHFVKDAVKEYSYPTDAIEKLESGIEELREKFNELDVPNDEAIRDVVVDYLQYDATFSVTLE